MASIESVGVDKSLLRHAWLILMVALAAGCATTPMLQKNEYYPSHWPAIADDSKDCRVIEGTYENKGVLINEEGQTHEIWLTDLWLADVLQQRREAALRTYEMELAPFRTCERVNMKIEPFAHPAGALVGDAKWQLVIQPTRRSAVGPPGRFEPCEIVRAPSPGDPYIGTGHCTRNSFLYLHGHGGSNYTKQAGLASDGSLIVKVHNLHIGAIPPVVVFFWTDNGWARFGRIDTASVKPNRDLSALRTYYVVKFDPDARGVNQLIAAELQRKGLEAATGLEAETPESIDAIVAYRDKWMGDVTKYIGELTVFIREPESQRLLATATVSQTSRTLKSPEELVSAALTNIFSRPTKSSSDSTSTFVTFGPYESMLGARVAAPPQKATVRIEPVRDARRDAKATLIGERSALGVSMGNIEMSPIPVEMIGQLLRVELGMLGHRSVGSGAEVVIDARLTKFEVLTPSTVLYWDINGVIAVDLVVTGRDGKRKDLHYETICTDRTYVNPSESLIKGVVSTCLASLGAKVREDPSLARMLGDR